MSVPFPSERMLADGFRGCALWPTGYFARLATVKLKLAGEEIVCDDASMHRDKVQSD
jgi:hypothetical protein